MFEEYEYDGARFAVSKRTCRFRDIPDYGYMLMDVNGDIILQRMPLCKKSARSRRYRHDVARDFITLRTYPIGLDDECRFAVDLQDMAESEIQAIIGG